ncbi:MAG: RecQ family ATP-dependent DNA helicase [Psychrobium sp.]
MLEQQLSQTFGFDQFRVGQQPVVEAILRGESAAAIFPTGSGKSLCYQFPATQLPHLTLVISPLLALMQDQLAFLHSKGIAAGTIDSTQTPQQSQQVMSDVRDGRCKILMVSVERLNNERFRQFLSSIPISLLVIDEAHCISEWGHNFRPDYLKLPRYQRQFNIPQVLLLTATATEKVVADMGRKFAIPEQNITLTGFYRSNLNLNVVGCESDKRLSTLSQWLTPRRQQCGVVYVTLQKTAQTLAADLAAQGLNAVAYHAGMDSDERARIVSDFMSSSNQIIVATIAFGMGIDKSDIRFVAHFDMPKSIENYAQEIGRAGRDGMASDCLVLANRDNLNVLQNFVYADTPSREAIKVVLDQIRQYQTSGQWEVIENALSSDANIRPLTLKTLLVYLELLNVIKPSYSYFAQYKYKILSSQSDITGRFDGERARFIQAIFDASKHARVWSVLDFDALYQQYASERSRVISALEYLQEQGAIELQTAQMTQVFQINPKVFDGEALVEKLCAKFEDKEVSEINRIDQLMAFFESDACLSQSLSRYFSDHCLTQACGHCSVCAGQVAVMPKPKALTPLASFDYGQLTSEITQKYREHTELAISVSLLARFLCGLTTPIFTKLKARSMSHFAVLEAYPFAEVRQWIDEQIRH